MARKIRDDLRGVVYTGFDGSFLKAGDEVPEGVSLGDHLFAESESDADDGKPAGNASLDDWQEYAKSQGASDENIDGLSRNELREQFGK